MSARLIHGLPARLLGPHVGRRAENHPRLRHRRRRERRRVRSACGARTPQPARAPSPTRSRAPSPCRRARTLMFAGFRSRWMMPCSCAASSASAICLAIGSASSSGIAPRAIRCDRSSPSTSSMTSALTPLSPPGRGWPRCSDGSATRAPGLRAGSARAVGVGGERGGQDLDARPRDSASCRVAR